jgi:hypothetical protein
LIFSWKDAKKIVGYLVICEFVATVESAPTTAESPEKILTRIARISAN